MLTFVIENALPVGNKVLAFFDVLSWGYGAYVYLHVNAPSGREIQKFEAQSEGRVEFVATEDGEHSFCFKNAYTETEVSFWINTETDSALSDVAKEGRLFLLRETTLRRHARLPMLMRTHVGLASGFLTMLCIITIFRLFVLSEHVNDMVYSVEKLNSLVSAARVDLEAFKAREHHHRDSTYRFFHAYIVCCSWLRHQY